MTYLAGYGLLLAGIGLGWFLRCIFDGDER